MLKGVSVSRLAPSLRSIGRGRDGRYLPPAQIRTFGTTTYGSCLRYVTRSVPLGEDEQFWGLVCKGRLGVYSAPTEACSSGFVA